MPVYAYQARDEGGRLVKGVLEAESQVALADRLRRMGYLVTRMEEGARSLAGLASRRWGRGVSREDFLLTFVQLASLVEAGIPLVGALRAVASQNPSNTLGEALERVAREIEAGRRFSEALSVHPGIFPKFLVSLVAVGETTGKLGIVLGRYASFLEKDLAFRRAIQGALTYPAFLLGVSGLLILLFVSLVVPEFADLFGKAGLALPAPTRILSALGLGLRHHGWLLGLTLVAGGAGAKACLRMPTVRRRMDAGVLKLPWVGGIVHQTGVARFSRNLATLIGSGIPVLHALETARGVLSNAILSDEIQRARAAVERGERIATTLAVGAVFHPDVIQMVRVGEESGRLDEMLDKAAEFYERRVSFSLKQMATGLEPALLVALGGLIGFIMASLLLPMFDMVKVLQRGGFR